MPTISHFYGIIIVMYLRNKEYNHRMYMQLRRILTLRFLLRPEKSWKENFRLKLR